jgi:hypothetical protein
MQKLHFCNFFEGLVCKENLLHGRSSILLIRETLHMHSTEWSRSHAAHSWHVLLVKKIKYIEIRKKFMLYLVLAMSLMFSDACIHTFPHVWCNLVKSLCNNRKWFTKRSTANLFGTGELENISLNSFWQVIRTGCHVVFSNEHSVLLWKTSLHFDCWKATHWLAWASYSMMWPAWAVVQAQWYCLFSNPV